MAKKFFRQQIDISRLPSVLRYKWGDEALEEGVTGVPKKLVRVLSSVFNGPTAVEALQVALTLVDYRRESESRLPTVVFLAYLAGLSEEVFLARLQELRDRGLVQYSQVREALSFSVDGLLAQVNDLARSDKVKIATEHRPEGTDDKVKYD